MFGGDFNTGNWKPSVERTISRIEMDVVRLCKFQFTHDPITITFSGMIRLLNRKCYAHYAAFQCTRIANCSMNIYIKNPL